MGVVCVYPLGRSQGLSSGSVETRCFSFPFLPFLLSAHKVVQRRTIRDVQQASKLTHVSKTDYSKLATEGDKRPPLSSTFLAIYPLPKSIYTTCPAKHT